MEVISLHNNVYAIRFPYHMVTERTLGMAIPHNFRLDFVYQRIRFAEESASEAGKKRANAKEIQRCFPEEIGLLRGQVDDLKDYVIFKVESAR